MTKRIKCLSFLGPLKQSKVTRMLYVVIIGVIILIGIILITPSITGWFQRIFCRDFNYYLCDLLIGYDAVYRIGFALSLWFLLLTFATFGVTSSDDERANIQNGWWPSKLFSLLLVEVLFIAIPHTDYNGEIWIFFGLNGAFCYTILQYGFILDAAHSFNVFSETITNKKDFSHSAASWLKVAKILATVILFAVSLLSSTTFYFLYASAPECFDNLIFLIFHLVMCSAASLIAVLPVIHEASPQSGLFPCSVTSLYCTYLIWLAFSCQPDGRCNPSDAYRYPGSPMANIQVLITLLITFGTLVMICVRDLVAPQFGKTRLTNTSEGLGRREESEYDSRSTCEDSMTSMKTNNPYKGRNPFAPSPQVSQEIDTCDSPSIECPTRTTKEEHGMVWDDEINGVEYSYSFFHVTFCLATIYLVMTITNWYRLDEGEHLSVRLIRSWSAVWLRISAGIFCSFILIWSMVVPLLFPESYRELLYFQYMTSLPKSVV